MPFYPQSEIDARSEKTLFPGVSTRTWWGDNLLLSRVVLEPNAEAPLHNHVNEQGGIVISGQLNMEIDGVMQTLLPGEMYLAPSNAPHRAVAGPEGCTVIECFSPLREPLMY